MVCGICHPPVDQAAESNTHSEDAADPEAAA
jgi:hypothetical protein